MGLARASLESLPALHGRTFVNLRGAPSSFALPLLLTSEMWTAAFVRNANTDRIVRYAMAEMEWYTTQNLVPNANLFH